VHHGAPEPSEGRGLTCRVEFDEQAGLIRDGQHKRACTVPGSLHDETIEFSPSQQLIDDWTHRGVVERVVRIHEARLAGSPDVGGEAP